MTTANPPSPSPPPRAPITAAATSFTHSYARAMSLSSPAARAPIPLVAAALGAHYAADTTAYTLGHRMVFASAAAAAPGIAAHLARFERSGLGCAIAMAALRVEPVSAGSALCWVTWAIEPRAGGPFEGRGWRWENVYAYRRPVEEGGAGAERRWVGGDEAGGEGWEVPEGWWEFMLSDNELLSILERVPNFMEL
ncbi:hypothetical protein B0H13DRAFT_1937502 [Neofusicoccum parvum]|nr:hypothetical protein B0H13DRAFT_1937502 [Neofusicoccum parvum]